MSTKAIREALERLVDLDHPNTTDDHRKLHAEALAEVEAIEEASRILDEHGVVQVLYDRSQEDAIDAAGDLLASLHRSTP